MCLVSAQCHEDVSFNLLGFPARAGCSEPVACQWLGDPAREG